MKKLVTSLLAVFLMLNGQSSNAKDVAASGPEIRVRLAYKLPLDPLNILSMADYDIALLLSRCWFDYDESARAISGVVKKWSFDEANGTYNFEINKDSKWSDGSQITSADLIFNLKRAKAVKSTYGSAIDGMVKIDSLKAIDDLHFSVVTRSKKPAPAFFPRMGSIFSTIVHPSDVKDNVVVSNKLSAGPYILSSIGNDELKFNVNPHYVQSNKKAAKAVIVRKLNQEFDLSQFLDEKTWENLVQTSTMLPSDMAKKVEKLHLPTWSRGHDRITLLKPMNGDLKNKRDFLKFLGSRKKVLKDQELSFNSKVANSLQPEGYVLFDEVKSEDYPGNLTFPPKTKFKVLASKSPSTGYQVELINTLLKGSGVEIEWDLKPSSEFMSLFSTSKEHDFLLFSFGSADPEPVTWMGLVVRMKFVDLTKEDLKSFEKATKIKSQQEEISAFKSMLRDWALRGSYLPLFHSSTLSIGHRNLDFSLIKELDETVDYSKIILK